MTIELDVCEVYCNILYLKKKEEIKAKKKLFENK